MSRPALSSVALALLLAGCAGSHRHAEVPDFTEKGWSEPSAELTSAKADRSIQSEGGGGAKGGATSAPAPVAEPAPAATPEPATTGKPEASSDVEAAVIRGDALPPPPPGMASPAKTGKPHKARRGKRSKRTKTNKPGDGTNASSN